MKPTKKDNKPKNDIASAYAKQGTPLVITPKKGEKSTKDLKVGNSTTKVPNGVYIPKPLTPAAKAPVPAPAKAEAKKSGPAYKAPTAKQTGYKQAHKKSKSTPKCKVY